MNRIGVKKHLVLLFAVFGWSVQLFSQEVWTIEKCVEYAFEHNTAIVLNQLRAENADEQIASAKYVYAPTVNGFAYHEQVAGISADASSFGSGSAGISAELDLYHGFANKHKLASSKLAYEYAMLAVENDRIDIAYAVAHAYLLAAESSEMKAIIETQIELTNEQLSQVQIMVDAGQKPVTELLKLKLQLSNEKMQLTDAKKIEQQHLQELMELLRLPVDQINAFAIESAVDKWESVLAVDIDSLYVNGLSISPLVRMSDKRTELSQMEVKQVKTERSPHLTASCSLYSSYNGMLSSERAGSSIPGEMSVSAGLNLSVPIFNRMQTKQRISNAQVQVKESQLQADETKLKVAYVLSDLLLEYNTAVDKFNQHHASVEIAKENFRLTQAQYDAGGISLIDYSIIKNQLSQEELSLSRSKYQMVFQKLLLQYYLNGSLF